MRRRFGGRGRGCIHAGPADPRSRDPPRRAAGGLWDGFGPATTSGQHHGAGAGATVLVFSATGLGGWQPAAVVSLLALGPAIDIAMAGRSVGGWRLYLRFAVAGVLANALAFFLRGGISLFGLDNDRPHILARFDLRVFASFAACGAIAGLLSALVCFQFSAKREER